MFADRGSAELWVLQTQGANVVRFLLSASPLKCFRFPHSGQAGSPWASEHAAPRFPCDSSCTWGHVPIIVLLTPPEEDPGTGDGRWSLALTLPIDCTLVYSFFFFNLNFS